MLVPAQSPVSLVWAGGTFPAPIYQKWVESFEAHSPGLAITYQPLGSEKSIEQLRKHEVDFAASDFPPDAQTRSELGIRLIPTLVGAVVAVYNLPEVFAQLRLTPNLLAGIYLGKITKWDDPQIKALNRQAHLPAEDIVVVQRSDGSGTTYVWTEYLSQGDGEWKNKVGTDALPRWPIGRGEVGNEGVAEFVARTPFSIGYVEFIYALKRHLSFASVKNPAGDFVQASIDTLNAAASTASIHSDGAISIVNAPGRNSYPLSSFTWLLIPNKLRSDEKRARLGAFLDWILSSGQQQVQALGYVPLPPGIAERERAEFSQLWTR
jgi:phosphate transport system substrate-binding protein